jgi:2-dehydropantoate 2-reductase
MKAQENTPKEETKPKTIKVAIAGAGAMGTLFGTQLIKGGHDVIFMDAWEKLINDMKENPNAVRVNDDGTEEKIPVKVYSFKDAPQEPFDLVWIVVKSSDTDKTLQMIKERGMINDKTVFLTLQGGFDNPDIIAKYQTNTKLLLYGKTCSQSSGTPGVCMKIQKFKLDSTTVWALGTGKDEEADPRVKEIVEAIVASGLPMELTPIAIADRWKMLIYYPANIAVSAIVNLDFGTCWACEPLKDVLIKLAEECAIVAKLENVDEKHFNKEISIEAVRKMAVDEGPRHQGSMNQDIFNKRQTEIEATAGALLRLAKKHNVDLPYTKTIYGIIKAKETNYGNECRKFVLVEDAK